MLKKMINCLDFNFYDVKLNIFRKDDLVIGGSEDIEMLIF